MSDLCRIDSDTARRVAKRASNCLFKVFAVFFPHTPYVFAYLALITAKLPMQSKNKLPAAVSSRVVGVYT